MITDPKNVLPEKFNGKHVRCSIWTDKAHFPKLGNILEVAKYKPGALFKQRQQCIPNSGDVLEQHHQYIKVLLNAQVSPMEKTIFSDKSKS